MMNLKIMEERAILYKIIPAWVEHGDEIEFFEPGAAAPGEKGQLSSLLLPGVSVASGSVSRLRLEDGLNAQTDKGISFDFSLNRSGQSVAGKHAGLGGQGE